MFGSFFFYKRVWQTELFALLTPSDGTLVLFELSQR